MCENTDSKTALRKLEERLLTKYHNTEGKLEVDERNAYFKGKAIPLELWRQQTFQLSLPADTYLDIAALAENTQGNHQVSHENRRFVIEVGGLVQSQYGQYRLVSSVMPES